MAQTRSIDLSNQKFNNLLCIRKVGVNKQRQSLWLVRCDCGTEKIIEGTSVRTGRVISCGCKRIEKVRRALIKNLEGKRFGNLIALRITGKNKTGQQRWKCLCDCGKETEVDSSSLLAGRTRSCGCLVVKAAQLRKGPKHPNWNPSKTDLERKIERKYQEYYDWSKSVKQRDNYICQCCFSRGIKLSSHHIENYSSNKNKRLDINNGITLCSSCHTDFHIIYGKKNNSRQQLDEYIHSKCYMPASGILQKRALMRPA